MKRLFITCLLCSVMIFASCGSRVVSSSSQSNNEVMEAEETTSIEEIKEIDEVENNDSLPEEEDSTETTEEKGDSEVTYVAQKDYEYGENGTLKIGLTDDQTFVFAGENLSEEEATALFTYVNSILKETEINYSVFAKVAESDLYVGATKNNSNFYIFGTERDGSSVLTKPQWVDEVGESAFLSESLFQLMDELSGLIDEFINSVK